MVQRQINNFLFLEKPAKMYTICNNTRQLTTIAHKRKFFVQLKKYQKPVLTIAVSGPSAPQGFQQLGILFFPDPGHK
jgi:hypothetical protein